MSVVVEDFDGVDGPDVAVLGEVGRVSVLLNRGGGTFAPERRFVIEESELYGGLTLALSPCRASARVTATLRCW